LGNRFIIVLHCGIGVLYETALDPYWWREVVGLCGLYAGSGVDAHFLTIDKKYNTPTTPEASGNS
jgi:hypothetical protein